jgi:hypothetical protein
MSLRIIINSFKKTELILLNPSIVLNKLKKYGGK